MRNGNDERLFRSSARPRNELDRDEIRTERKRIGHLNQNGDGDVQRGRRIRFGKFRIVRLRLRRRPGPHVYRRRLRRNDRRRERALYGDPPDRHSELGTLGNGRNLYVGL